MPTPQGDGKFHFAIDRGGTFTDLHCRLPNGTEVVSKLLSVDPANYNDAPTEGIRRLLSEHDPTGKIYPREKVVDTSAIGSIRMGTTVATNALLEREGERMGLVITKGFGDLLKIGDQTRRDIFDLSCKAPEVLYEEVVEIDERIMLAEFFDENKSEEEIELLERKSQPQQPNEDSTRHYSTNNWPDAGVGKRIAGVTGEKVIPLRRPDGDAVRASLKKLADKGIRALAIVFLHSYVYPDHENMVGDIAKSMGCFSEISLSWKLGLGLRMVPRGHTACAAAYLTPKITSYLAGFTKGFDDGLMTNVQLDFMKSDGGLAPVTDFGGHQAILSGPAGGVVGYAKTAYRPNLAEDGGVVKKPMAVIGFDMGGTSTDVSRYDGTLEHVFETTVAGVSIQAPQLDIHTVAAGGGSRLFLKNGLFIVGPESSKAHPGPICYRKNGYLAVTDANLVLGRVLPDHFPNIFGPNEDEPLDLKGAREAFASLAKTNKAAEGRTMEELAYGFLQVANEAMCRPIRNLTQMRGFDITKHALACFGGAGPQHACAMARALGISKVYVHRYGGILSAYGLSMADAVVEEQEPAKEVYAIAKFGGSEFDDEQDPSLHTREARLAHLVEKAESSLVKQGYPKESIVIEKYLNMRYEGTDNAIMIKESKDLVKLPYAKKFVETYHREFGFAYSGRNLLIDDMRVRAFVPGVTPTPPPTVPLIGTPTPAGSTRAYFKNGWETVSTYSFDDLKAGHLIKGPSIIFQSISTIVLEIGCAALVTADGNLDISVTPKKNEDGTKLDHVSKKIKSDIEEDPVQLSIYAHRFMGIAEQMGRTLARTAISVNIKERLDFSCALFTNDGGLVANAPHIPVHLGAMQFAVKFQKSYWNSNGREGIKEGDVLVSNHPQLAGGSHLPDITVITPVFHEGNILFFVASRGHHSDIGGICPGSMPPHSKLLKEEGASIVAFKLVKDGKFQEEGIADILVNQECGGTRNLKDNISDLRAQVAANNSGIRLLQSLVRENGLENVKAYMHFIQNNAEMAVRNMLKSFAASHGTRACATDYLDDGSPIELTIDIDPSTGSACFNFEGTGNQILGNLNAPPAVTYSAVIYSLRSLCGQDIPLNQGCLAPIEFKIPPFSLLNPSDDLGVVGGNVLTSQRVVDVVLKAFKAAAASQGCMNNLTFGDEQFGYYETIAGGAGAGPTWDGRSGVHTHCTNTRITDPEILERRYPVMLRQFRLRTGSGGAGMHPGGNGVVREIEPLRPLVMSILSERRSRQPYGLEGGEAGKSGRNLLIKKDGSALNIGGKQSASIDTGERLVIETPGGGGYGLASRSKLSNADGNISVVQRK